MKKLGILISGRGSNMLALADAVRDGRIPEAEIALVISNSETAGGLAKAQECGIPTVVLDHRGVSAVAFALVHSRISTAHFKYSSLTVTCLYRPQRAAASG